MYISTLQELIRQVGFNGALVVALLYFGHKFLDRVLNHMTHIQTEMEKHTQLLTEILTHTRRRRHKG